MDNRIRVFERIARVAARVQLPVSPYREHPIDHPFDVRDIHPKFPIQVRTLFDDGHFAQATFEAYKYIDNEIQRLSGIHESGKKLMMRAFSEESPAIRVTATGTVTERDIQEGYKFIFAGSSLAIRNPRAHEHSIVDAADTCLDHLSIASHLLRRLEDSGYELSNTAT